jgi:hypothetical protein
MSTDHSTSFSDQVTAISPREHSVTPYLTVNNGSKALIFTKGASTQRSSSEKRFQIERYSTRGSRLVIRLLGYLTNYRVSP